MASHSLAKRPPEGGPTTFYFAYGSNLHLKQMKRRCPNSKYVGKARLVNYRWQINERGYANVVEAEGHWVDGLVYEINTPDEAKLDINEGVSKNAYTKRLLKVQLHRAPSILYRRPVSWIVNRGGPSKICRQATAQGQKTAEHKQHWVQDVLVYISLNYVQDSQPKDEYVNRINLGIVDARALGIDEDYISNCVRPLIPAPEVEPQEATEKTKLKPALRGQKRNASPRTGERSPARKAQSSTGPNKQTPQGGPAMSSPNNDGPKRRALSGQMPPPLPPRPVGRYRDVPIVVVEEFHYSSRSF